jgi:GT2 family glycosyltransferase
MDNPAVWVVLVNWNGRAVTLDCLASLHRVRYPGMHVLAVDNGSADGSVEAIRKEYPDVEVLPLSENRRFAGGNNAGIQKAIAAGAAFVVLLNNDTLVDPDFLSALLGRFHSEERCGMVVPKIYYHHTPDLLWYAGGEISFWTGTMRHRGIREHDHGQYDESGNTGYATGCCILVSRDLIARIGLLDDSFFIYAEDADWSMRARRAGYRIVYEPRARVWHRLSVSAGGHLSFFKLKNKAVSNFRFMARYARWYHWLTFPWLNVLVNAWAAVRYLMQSRFAASRTPDRDAGTQSPG